MASKVVNRWCPRCDHKVADERDKQKRVCPKCGGEIPVKTFKSYRCTTCKSTDVKSDAWAVWDEELQIWVLSSTFDNCFCEKCDGECDIEMFDLDTGEALE